MARCENPFYKDGIPCPCGKCEPCRVRHASGWGFRITKEAERLGSAFFITLTYSPEHAPKKYEVKKEGKTTHYQETKRLTVDIYHLQKFIKRLRKRNNAKEIKYYGVSEYGDQSFRPHYHIIIMGMDLVSFIGLKQWQQIQEGKKQLNGMDTFEVDTWKLGHVTIGECTTASIAYTLKYVSKGRKIPQYEDDDRQPEKSIMSKGMGLSYITPEIKKLHNQDIMRQYVVTNESKKIPIPRYLKERLYDHLERQHVADIMANKELDKRLKMGGYEREKYERSLRKKIDTYGIKNKNNQKGKI